MLGLVITFAYSLHNPMDALKAEIAVKRKALQDDPVTATRQKKYMRRGEIAKLKEELELPAKERASPQLQVDKTERKPTVGVASFLTINRAHSKLEGSRLLARSLPHHPRLTRTR